MEATANAKTYNNIGETIKSKMNKGLHRKRQHPLCILKEKIYEYFGEDFHKFDNLDPVVSTKDNFDRLLIPEDHPSRSLTDTYFYDKDTVLRTHTTAHQHQLLEQGYEKFLVTGDVFRKDTIDKCHFPVFHQIEGLEIIDDNEDAYERLKEQMVGLVTHLFPGCKYVLNDHEFPFTDPSFEIEVEYEGDWMEVLGCGVVKDQIMKDCGYEGKKAYAFGLGLERLAMVLFEIPDIRYFWTEDNRFLSQFEPGKITTFQEYSSYPPCYKDISFWYGDDFNELDFLDLIREEASDLVEEVELVDDFTHPKTGKTSKTYKITYRDNNRSLTNEEINEIQERLRDKVSEQFDIELR